MAVPVQDALFDNAHILGASFIKALNDPANALFNDGRRRWTKHQIVTELGTGNFHAARNLVKTMKLLKFTKMEEFFAIPAGHLADIKGVGTTTLYVLLCYAHYRKIDIKKWYTDGVTFAGLKRRSEHEEARERKEAAARIKSKKHRHLKIAGNRILERAAS